VQVVSGPLSFSRDKRNSQDQEAASRDRLLDTKARLVRPTCTHESKLLVVMRASLNFENHISMHYDRELWIFLLVLIGHSHY
jgi:hypothetical protein